VGLLESIAWTVSWIVYNQIGYSMDSLNIFVALLSTMKLTFIRTVVLLIAIGYSITYATLDIGPKLGVIILTLLYGTVAGISEFVKLLTSIDLDVPMYLVWTLALMLVIINGFYIIWIAYAMYLNFMAFRELSEKSNKDKKKFEMYKVMVIGLAIFAAISILCFSVECYLSAFHYQDSLWNIWWAFGAYWQCYYCLLILFVACLWKPNKNNLRYNYTYITVTSSPSQIYTLTPLKYVQSVSSIYDQKEEPRSPLKFPIIPKGETGEVKKIILANVEDESFSSEMDELVL